MGEKICHLLLNDVCIEIIEQDKRSLVSSDETDEVAYLRAYDASLFVASLNETMPIEQYTIKYLLAIVKRLKITRF